MGLISEIIYQLKYWFPFIAIENVVESCENSESRKLIGGPSSEKPSYYGGLNKHQSAQKAFKDDTKPTDNCIEGYRSRKILAESGINVALFWHNAKQLHYVIVNRIEVDAIYHYMIVSLIVSSLILQIGVGILLVSSASYNLTCLNEENRKKCRRYGDIIAIGILLIALINIFISAFQDDPSYTNI